MRDMMQRIPIGVFLMMLGFVLAMAGVLVFAAIRARRTAAAVASAKAEPIGMATDGYRRFEGRAEAIGGETLRAPLTGATCVWYDARLEKWTRSSQMKESSWVTVRQVTSSAPVLVRDGTGACLVEAWIADVTPTDKSRWTGAGPEPADRLPPRLGPSQSFSGIEVSGGPNSQYRYSESRIYPGDALLVVGLFSSGRFSSTDDDDEDEDEDVLDDAAADGVDGHAGDDATESNAWRAYDHEREATLWRLGAEVTRAQVSSGGKDQPIILAAATAATHVAMNEMGAQAALYVALVPLGIAALMLFARFG